MNLRTQRLLDRWIGQILCALVSAWARVARPAKPPAQAPESVRHVLVVLLSEMGSLVLAGPMLARIRQVYPHAQLHLLQLRKNQAVSRLLQLAPESHLHAIDDGSALGLLQSVWQTMKALRGLPVDVVIDCELFSRISALLSYGCGAPRIAGFTPHTQEGLYRGSFVNCAVAYNPYRHISQQFVALVDALEPVASLPRSKWSLLDPSTLPNPIRVDFTPAELAEFHDRVRRDHPAVAPQLAEGRLVLLYASGGILPERAWPPEHFSALARALTDAGYAVAFVGLPEDRALSQRILDGAGQPTLGLNLAGYTKSLRELLALMHGAALLVANDGGPGHFAALTPIEVIMFFGPETARLYGSLSPRATAIDLQLPCSPCLTAYNHRLTFCDGDNQCLQQIAPERVIALALSKLKQTFDNRPGL